MVDYTVAGWGAQNFPGYAVPDGAEWGPNGYPGDKVELQQFTGSLDLTPGTYQKKINTLLWTGYYTYAGTPSGGWDELIFNFSTPRNLSVDGHTTSVSQNGLLAVNYDTDYLSFSAGSTVSLYVQGYRVDITPLGLAPAGAGWSGPIQDGIVQDSRDLMAEFVVTLDASAAAVPEPSTYIAGALLLLPFGASTLRVLRKKLTA